MLKLWQDLVNAKSAFTSHDWKQIVHAVRVTVDDTDDLVNAKASGQKFAVSPDEQRKVTAAFEDLKGLDAGVFNSFLDALLKLIGPIIIQYLLGGNEPKIAG